LKDFYKKNLTKAKRSALRRPQQQRSLSRLSFTRTHIHRSPHTTHTHAHCHQDGSFFHRHQDGSFCHQDGSFCKTFQMFSLLHDAVVRAPLQNGYVVLSSLCIAAV
jgi:hypothetical protein